MKHYLVKYKSDGNLIENKQLYVGPCYDIVEAQDKFFDWLKKQDLYKRMWKLNVEFEEIISL